MSVEAITWALKQPVSHSSAKFVLVVLANCARAEDGYAFPSTTYIAEATGQDRKTVIANLDRLIGWGLIEDTGKRAGQTKQVIVYRLCIDGDLFEQRVPKSEQFQKRNSPKNGTVPKTDGNSTVFPLQQSQKRDTEPSITIKEPEEQKHVQPAAAPSRFEEFWRAYPNKKGKQEAEKTWRKRKLDPRCDELVAHVYLMQQADDAWKRGYVPMGSTYLNQARWEDVPQRPPDAGPRAGGQPGKQMQGLMALEEMKRGLVRNRDFDGSAEDGVLLLGTDAGR